LIYTSSLIPHHNPVFIESIVVFPGDIVSFDISTAAGISPYIGFSSEIFTDPANLFLTVSGGSGDGSGSISNTITIRGEYPQYMFVFVQKYNSVPVETYFYGTIVIDRAGLFQ